MDVTSLAARCPRCGNRLSPDAPDGLCAACLFTAGAETLTHATGSETPTVLSPLSASAAGSDDPRLETGQRFGPYRIGRLLGRGGMGEVYEAEHADTGRQIALKVLRGRLSDAEDRARFLHEGQLAASVSHPHTVYIFGSEEIAGMPVISMELLPGGTLKDRVASRGPLSSGDAVAAMLDIIGGLDAAQAAGILHRDIKPSNCFVDVDGAVKVGDFGLSISTLARDVQLAAQPQGFQGTPQFAAPEQLLGRPLDLRADIYAAGATLYYLLTARPPFDAADLRTLVDRVTTEPPTPPRTLDRRIPAAVSAAVLSCLAKDPRDRPASYAALAETLRPYATGAMTPARLGLRAIAGAIDTLVIGLPFSLMSTVSVEVVQPGGFQTSVPASLWSVAAGAVYFLLLEGRWGASLGKRLLGLRVTSTAGATTWRQIAARVATYYLPAMPMLLAIGAMGRADLVAFMNANPAAGVAGSLSTIVLTACLFTTVRQRNGYAAVHDLVSGTRVVERPAALLRRGAREASRPDATPRAAAALVTRCGPFDVTGDLGEAGGSRLLDAFDPMLRRRVWIRAVPQGTPAIADARRDAGRVGRLHWLAGRRSTSENWDAFEAPDGGPLLSERHRRPAWTDVKTWLGDLATELSASEREGSTPRLGLDRVWIRRDGRAVLLDFPAPPAVITPGARAQAGAHPHDALTPVALLAAVARLALPDARVPSAGGPPPLPLSVLALVERWTSHTAMSLDRARAELAAAGASPDRVSHLRRAIPIGLAAVPILLVLMGGVAIAPVFRTATSPARFEIFALLAMIDAADAGRSSEFRDAAHREAVEIYLVGRHGPDLTADRTWAFTQGRAAELRDVAERLVARRPAVSETELARATQTLAADLAESAASYDQTVAPVLRRGPGVIVAALLLIAGAFVLTVSLVSTLIRPGGVLLHLVGLAVVTRDGRPITRLRSIARVLLVWSPLIVWLAWLGPSPVASLMSESASPIAAAAIVLAVLGTGALWTLLRATRGPHDHLLGTWVVPR